MRYLMLLLPILATPASATVVHVPIQSGLVLQPNESRSITVESTELVEIGWQAVKPCAVDCIQMTPVTRGDGLPFKAASSALGRYTPLDGKVSVEFKNISHE